MQLIGKGHIIWTINHAFVMAVLWKVTCTKLFVIFCKSEESLGMFAFVNHSGKWVWCCILWIKNSKGSNWHEGIETSWSYPLILETEGNMFFFCILFCLWYITCDVYQVEICLPSSSITLLFHKYNNTS
jgi:hypothetical protein